LAFQKQFLLSIIERGLVDRIVDQQVGEANGTLVDTLQS
jgi:hypothetical protein